MNRDVTPVLSSSAPPVPVIGGAHSLLRIFQVFVNVDGLKIRGPRILGVIPSWRRYGFYAVMLIAADEQSKPPALLALARAALTSEFSPLSSTPPELWRVQMVDWRMVGAAPPLFREPGCIDDGWGAAWYEGADQKAKQHRYRLVKTRLWKGRRATKPPPPKESVSRGIGS